MSDKACLASCWQLLPASPSATCASASASVATAAAATRVFVDLCFNGRVAVDRVHHEKVVSGGSMTTAALRAYLAKLPTVDDGRPALDALEIGGQLSWWRTCVRSHSH